MFNKDSIPAYPASAVVTVECSAEDEQCKKKQTKKKQTKKKKHQQQQKNRPCVFCTLSSSDFKTSLQTLCNKKLVRSFVLCCRMILIDHVDSGTTDYKAFG